MRILLLEDDSQLGDALANGLRQRGHAVDWFSNGEHADAALAVAPFDSAVLDLGLPGKDGLAWLRRWRDRGHQLPVLILTARDSIDQRVGGLDAGADDYLIKPISLDELSARLRAVQRRSSGRAHSVWRQGLLEFEPASRAVRWRGEPIDLTPRECALLEVLLSQPDRVLPKAHLQEKLHDWSGSEREGNSLEVHIHHLRRKIDPSVIRTVRGVGYALGPCGTPA